MRVRRIQSATTSVVVIVAVAVWLVVRSDWRPTSPAPFLAIGAAALLVVLAWRAAAGVFRR